MQSIADLFTSTELIPKRRSNKWIQRPGFGIRKVVILKWIVLGNILTLAYKKSLLSSLIPIRYEDTIETMFDVDKSGLQLILPKDSFTAKYITEDPKNMTSHLSKRAIFISWQFPPAQWILEM